MGCCSFPSCFRTRCNVAAQHPRVELERCPSVNALVRWGEFNRCLEQETEVDALGTFRPHSVKGDRSRSCTSQGCAINRKIALVILR